MSVSDEYLGEAVDGVLEPAWPHERRGARRRLVYSTLGRVALGLLEFFALSLGVSLIVGVAFSSTFYVFIGGLTTMAALHGVQDPDHLRKD